MIVLDTNVLSALMRAEPDRTVLSYGLNSISLTVVMSAAAVERKLTRRPEAAVPLCVHPGHSAVIGGISEAGIGTG